MRERQRRKRMNAYPSNTIGEKYNEIAEFCAKTKQPVFLTENEKINLVVLDINIYNKLIRELRNTKELLEIERTRLPKRGVYLNDAKNEFHKLLDEGIESSKLKQGLPAEEVFSEIEAHIKKEEMFKLLAVEESRLHGNKGYTLEELDKYLNEVLDNE